LNCSADGFAALAVIIFDGEDQEIRNILWRDGVLERNQSCPLPASDID